MLNIRILETTPCLADETKFKAITVTDRDITELLPYLNSIIDNPNYQEKSQSLTFKEGLSGITLKGNQINITKYANITELYEILDLIKDIIEYATDNKDEITPNYKSRKEVPVLKIYGLLPKTNCKKCGVTTCMAFATKLNKFDAKISECPLLEEEQYRHLKQKLISAFE